MKFSSCLTLTKEEEEEDEEEEVSDSKWKAVVLFSLELDQPNDKLLHNVEKQSELCVCTAFCAICFLKAVNNAYVI